MGVGRDRAEGGVGIFGPIVAFGKTGFDFDDGIGEEDGLLLEACQYLLPAPHTISVVCRPLYVLNIIQGR